MYVTVRWIASFLIRPGTAQRTPISHIATKKHRLTLPWCFAHGYGAPGHDLAGLAPEWIRLLGESAKSVRFIFPAAPHSLAELGMPDGRAWWPINMAQLSQAVQSSSFDELHDKEPPGIDEARAMLCESIRRVKAELIGDSTPLVLGGFFPGRHVDDGCLATRRF